MLFDYFHNCIYKTNLNKDILVFNIYNITTKQFIYYFDFQKQKNNKILVEYN